MLERNRRLEWCPISVEEALELEKPFEEEEVRRVVMECDGNKSPGPDGFFLCFLSILLGDGKR